MEALIKMLKNEKQNTYHPIMYFENMFPGGDESEGNQKFIRYKSKGHHTSGFINRNDALNSIEIELVEHLKDIGYNVNKELNEDIIWDGVGIPADVQIRNRSNA
jgi:hypothetical protein